MFLLTVCQDVITSTFTAARSLSDWIISSLFLNQAWVPLLISHSRLVSKCRSTSKLHVFCHGLAAAIPGAASIIRWIFSASPLKSGVMFLKLYRRPVFYCFNCVIPNCGPPSFNSSLSALVVRRVLLSLGKWLLQRMSSFQSAASGLPVATAQKPQLRVRRCCFKS